MNSPRAALSRRKPHPPAGRRGPTIRFKAFIAYADLPAARQAMRTISEVLAASGHPYELEPMLWRFDQLAAAKWREPALTDAALAAVIVLASSAPGSLAPEMETWLADLFARRHGRRTTLVALLGPDDAWTISIESAPAARATPAAVFHGSAQPASRAA